MIEKRDAAAASTEPGNHTHSLYFVVPGPPVPLARARVWSDAAGESHARTPYESRRYKKHVAGIAAIERQRHNARSGFRGPRWPMDAAYKLELIVYRAQRRGDADNFLKAVMDALQKVLYENDRQVVQPGVDMRDDPKRPRIEVSIEVLP